MHILIKNTASVLIILFLSTGKLLGMGITDLNWDSRLKLSGEMDSNIGEDPENKVSDKALKLFSQIGTKGFLYDKTQFNLDFKGGIRTYSIYSDENRFIGSINSNISRTLLQNIVFGVNGFLLYDYYKQDFRNSISYLGEGFIFVPRYVIKVLDINLSYQTFATDYKNNSFFNFRENLFNLMVKRNINPSLTLSVFTRFGHRDYDRKAFLKPVNENVAYKNELHNDNISEVGINLQYFRWVFIQIFSLYRNNNSNSYGFSYSEEKLGFILGKKITNNYMLKLYCDIESKMYKDPGQFHVIIDINEDKEMDNRAIIELTRSLNEHIGLEFRCEYSRNESRIRNLYYSKFLISSGLLYKF